MPTITVNVNDIFQLIGRSMSLEEFNERLRLAKAELDDYDDSTGEAKVELNDTNRPDLWCAEGIARQIRYHIRVERRTYPFFQERLETEIAVEVDPGLEKVRPYVAAFAAKGPPVTEPFLVQIIQTQEKLCENFGRKRRNVAIGIYNASKIDFPVRYVAAGADDFTFVPLGFEEAMSLDRIVEEHPKGREYGGLLEGLGAYPLLADASGKVLSMPPIINSRETGEVVVGDRHLFVEATGWNMRQLVLVMNIMAANFADRGWAVEPVLTRLPYDSELGREVVVPAPLEGSVDVDLGAFSRTMGEDYSTEEVVEALTYYGVETEVFGERIKARCPSFRDDYLHAVDAVEDFAVSRGFQTFEPEMPSRFTVGKIKPITLLCDRVRDHMVGLGFEEIFSNILTNRTVEREHMLIPDEPIITVDNVMSETYSVLRSSVLPSLLRVEAHSSKALYPHRLFEVGEVCVVDEAAVYGSRTEMRLAALWASGDSGFSQIHSVLDVLFYYLARENALRPAFFPFYFEGRAGEISIKDEVVGHIGEVHPEVLTRFGITMPCAAFEVCLDRI